MSEARLLGLDLAWSDKNPTGAAALAPDGTLLDVRADLLTNQQILAWVRRWKGERGVIGIDMPTIVRNPTGMRCCEHELGAEFRRQHAGPHPANLTRFKGGGRARYLIDELAADGVVEALDVRARDERARTVALEVFPHPAHVKLFDLKCIFKYKKKHGRHWDVVLPQWASYRSHLASLRHADPPLDLDDAVVPLQVDKRGYKRWDDMLDAITCAYIASFVWRWGLEPPHVRVFGDLQDGYIVVPDRAVFGDASKRVEVGHDDECDQKVG